MTQLVIRCTAVTLYTLQLDIRGLLKGYTATDYYYEYTKFVPYLLDDAVIGSVSCAPAKTNFDSGGLLPFIAAAASNTTVLAEGFANFLPTAAIEFHYENILTWKQVNDSLCAHGQRHPYNHPSTVLYHCNYTVEWERKVFWHGYMCVYTAGPEATEQDSVPPTGRWLGNTVDEYDRCIFGFGMSTS